jgi:hypothetical protein
MLSAALVWTLKRRRCAREASHAADAVWRHGVGGIAGQTSFPFGLLANRQKGLARCGQHFGFDTNTSANPVVPLILHNRRTWGKTAMFLTAITSLTHSLEL